MSRTHDELIEYIEDNFDPDDLCEIFELTTKEILDRFDDRVIQYRHKFEDYEEPEYES